jgi:methyl-accepting chemotaxis protein
MRSLSGKIIGGFVLISIVCVIFTSCLSYYEIYQISTENMSIDGARVANQIKNDLDLTGTDDITGVQNYVEAAKQMNNKINFVAYWSGKIILADSDKKEVGKTYENSYTEKVLKDKKAVGFIDSNSSGEKVYNVLVPYKTNTNTFNIVSVGMMMTDMNKRIYDAIKTILAAAILIIGLSLLLSKIIAKNILKPLNKFMSDFNSVSAGDLRVNFAINTGDEISELGEVMNNTMSNLRHMIKEIKTDVVKIDKTASKLSESSDIFSETSKESLVDLNEVSKGVSDQTIDMIIMEEMIGKFGVNLDTIYKKLDDVASNSEGIKISADSGTSQIINITTSLNVIQQSFTNVINKVEHLEESVNSIGQITRVINDVAGQTNLLALNAAIEAARVGEEGKGFAVVADEIRKLANQVLESSKSIGRLISNVKSETDEVSISSRLVSQDMKEQLVEFENAILTFKGILKQVGEIVPHIKEVEATLEVSVNEKNDLMYKIEAISGVSKKIAIAAEEISGALDNQETSTRDLKDHAENLNEMSKILTNSIEKFIV